MAQSSNPKNLKAVIRGAEKLQKRSNEFYDNIIGQIDDLFGSGSADEADIETIGRVLNEKHKKWFRREAVELRSHSIVGQNPDAKDFELGRGQGLVEDFPLSTEAERRKLDQFIDQVYNHNNRLMIKTVDEMIQFPKDYSRTQIRNTLETLIKCRFNMDLVNVRHRTNRKIVFIFKDYRELLEKYRRLQNRLNREYRPKLWKKLKECVENRKNFLKSHSYEGREGELIRYANGNYYLGRKDIKERMYKEGSPDDWNRYVLELEQAAEGVKKRLIDVNPQKGVIPAVIDQFDEYVDSILHQTVLAAENPRNMLPDSIDNYPVIEDFELKDLDYMKRYAEKCADEEKRSKDRLLKQRKSKRQLREAQVGGKTDPDRMKRIIKYLILNQHLLNISLPIDGLMSFKDYEKSPKNQAIKAYRPVLRQYLDLRQELQNALEEAVRKGFDEEVAQDLRERWEECIAHRLKFVKDQCEYGLTEAQAIRYANYDMYLDPTVRDRRKVQSQNQFGGELLETKDPCSVENLNDLLEAAKQIRTDLQQKLSIERENKDYIPLIEDAIEEVEAAKEKEEREESRLVPIGDTTEDTSEYQAQLTKRFDELYALIEARKARVPNNKLSLVYIDLLHRLVKIRTIRIRLKKGTIGVEVARDEDMRNYCDYDYNALFHYRATVDQFIKILGRSPVENAGLLYQLSYLHTRVSAEMFKRIRSKRKQLMAKGKQMYQDYLAARISKLVNFLLDNSADIPTDRLDSDWVYRLYRLVKLQTIYDMLIAGHIKQREARDQEVRDYRNNDYLFNFRATVRQYIGSLSSDPDEDAGLRHHLEHLLSTIKLNRSQKNRLQYQKDSLTKTISIPEPSGTTASTQPSERPTGTAITGSSTQLSDQELEPQVNSLLEVTAPENLTNLSDQSLDTHLGQTQTFLRQIKERAPSDRRVFNQGTLLQSDLVNISIAITGEQSRRRRRRRQRRHNRSDTDEG